MSHRDGVVGSGESAVLEERRRARHMQGAADMLAGETAETLGAPCGFARRDFSRAELHVVNIRHIQHHAAQLILPLRPAWYTEGGTDGRPARGWPANRSSKMNKRQTIRLTGSLCGCLLAQPAIGQLSFTEAAQAAGVDMVHNPFQIAAWGIGTMTPGGAVGDFNNDGWQDLFVISGGTEPDKLYINDGDGTFTDRAAQWGLTEQHRGLGAAVGDYNKDGWLDIYVTSVGVITAPPIIGAHRLYRNNAGQSFSEVAAAAGVNMSSPTGLDGFGAAFGDYDLDGDLDLFVAGWQPGGAGNRLFRNNGDETFTDVTVAAGVFDLAIRCFSPRFVDMDGDRYPELLLAADFGTSRYFVNNGDGTFTDETSSSGTGLDSNGMGSTVGDINNDGLFDWYVTSILLDSPTPGSGNMLYLNLGTHLYCEVSQSAGVNDGGWGWGTVAVDIDLDALVDFVETNGWPPTEFLNERAKVFRNNGNGTFDEIAATCGFQHAGQGRGLLNFDADNDGDQDFVVLSHAEPLEFYRNDLISTNSWLRVFLDTSEKPALAPDGFGSVVRATVGGQTYYRSADGGCNYLSQSELSAHFGLGSAAVVDELRVDWADGSVTVLSNVAVNQTITVSALLADINGDCAVNVLDLVELLLCFGQPAAPGCEAKDVNNDGIVNVLDLIELLLVFGAACP